MEERIVNHLARLIYLLGPAYKGKKRWHDLSDETKKRYIGSAKGFIHLLYAEGYEIIESS